MAERPPQSRIPASRNLCPLSPYCSLLAPLGSARLHVHVHVHVDVDVDDDVTWRVLCFVCCFCFVVFCCILFVLCFFVMCWCCLCVVPWSSSSSLVRGVSLLSPPVPVTLCDTCY